MKPLHALRPLPLMPYRSPSRRLVVITLAAAWLLIGPPALAEDDSRFSINATMTQAYGEVLDGPGILGLSPDGNFDYRSGALLFSYRLQDNDRFVIQLATEQLGDSLLDELRDEIELDWAFYEHTFTNGTAARVGRTPIPFGIYNEIRDVGTLLEFYRPPVSIYFEGAFSTETVDGLLVRHEFFADSPWTLSADLYAGEWDRLDYSPPFYFESKAKDAIGAQLWLQTPHAGLRFGLAWQNYDIEGGSPMLRVSESDPFESWLVSVDGQFGRFRLRAEWQAVDTQFLVAPEGKATLYYALVGYQVSDRFEVYFQIEDSTVHDVQNPFLPIPPFDITFYDEQAISLNYRVSPNVLLRLEGHRVETNISEIQTPPLEPFVRSDFALLSLSLAY